MKRKGNQGWRGVLGVLAVGMLAFGLSLQGAPGAGDTAGTADRVKKHGGDAGAASVERTRNKLEVASEQDFVSPNVDRGALISKLKVSNPRMADWISVICSANCSTTSPV